MKRIALSVVCVICIMCSFIAGFYYCKEMSSHGDNNTVQSDIERIAIVNLDEGIQLDGEKTLYSGKLLNFASDYVYVGLSEAKTGMEADMYAAYIMIPSDFSECIASINDTPQQVKIEYVINSSLTDKNRLEVEERLFTFKELLNSNAAYIYLNSVLSEFHSVQDSAVTIIEHDKTDLENIKEINPDDIFNMIDFSEMKETDNNIENVDLTQYLNKNTTEVAGIFSELDKGIADGQKKYQEITKDYKTVSTEIENVKNTVSDYNPLVDEKGDVVYQTGLNNLNKAIDEYNENVHVEEEKAIETLKNDIAEVAKEYIDEVLNEAQKKTDEELTEIQQENKDIVNNQVYEWAEQQQEYYTGLEKHVNEIIQGYRKDYIDQRDGSCNQIKAIGEDIVDEINKTSGKTIDKDVVRGLLNNYISQSVDIIKSNCNENMLRVIVFADYDENCMPDFENDKIELPEVEQLHIEPEQTETSEETETSEAEGVSEEDWGTGEISIDIDEDIDIENGLSKFTAEKQVDIEDIVKTIKSDIQVSKSDITDILDSQIIDVIESKNESEKESYNTAAQNLINSMQNYNDKVSGFNPYDYIKRQDITKHQTELTKNINALGNAMNTKNAEYLKFINKLYQNANLNITTLQGDMQKANDTSKKKLYSVITELKEDKESISEEDNQILGAFAEKLAYTRIGTLEYTEMYKFMANPIDVSGQTDRKKMVKTDDTDKLQLDYRWMLVLALSILLFMIIVRMLVKVIQERKELKAIENE